MNWGDDKTTFEANFNFKGENLDKKRSPIPLIAGILTVVLAIVGAIAFL